MRTAIALAGLAAAALLAGCGSGSGTHAGQAAAAASSVMANPTYSAEAAQLEGQLLANLQAEFKAHPGHPFTDGKTAIKDTFPSGDVSAIVQHGVQTFTLAVLHSSGPGSARQRWADGVIAFALTQGQNAATPRAPPPTRPGASVTARATPAGSPA